MLFCYLEINQDLKEKNFLERGFGYGAECEAVKCNLISTEDSEG